MKETINLVCKAVEQECKRFQRQDSSIIFNKENFQIFSDLFKRHYDDIMNRFMRDTRVLDAHKQAAIIIISILESKVVEHRPEGKISIVAELIAINVALSYMIERLNEKLSKKHITKIEKYSLPIAIACDTPYIEIMSRILYYEQTEADMSFNILELSDRLFLIEYMNLLENGINPYELREY